MQERAGKGGGTTNDGKARCIQTLQQRIEAQPSADLGALAHCVLNAATDADAAACK